MGRITTAAESAAPVATYLIRDMSPDERPRERLQRLGPEAVSEAELIAILLRTGMKGKSAVQIAQELLRTHQSLDDLSRVPREILARTKGIGPTKATHLKAAFELARRLPHAKANRKSPITTPAEAAEYLREEFRDADREEFRALLLNVKHGLIGCVRVSEGSVSASIVEPRELFKQAILASASAVLVAHNHPSGDPTPSAEDRAVTQQLVAAGRLLDIPVHDHVIIGRGRYMSFAESGLL